MASIGQPREDTVPIPLNDVQEGLCYKTPGDQYRRVVKIEKSSSGDSADDTVIYESWGGNKGNSSGHLPRTKAKRKTFAGDVDSTIACPTSMRPLGTVQSEL
ncbi:hypothetical protein [Azospirillum sp. Sh1]|uniref:hypothetical protein n=1 Tax=Azospirillum sp. Sh1 TaxID=2607285 RepID=UPI001256B50D|nr:hypothetical protein [Azospirillum sp. Sh1]KAA0573459.1 hypothetical protein FZ029_21000 [Azospirillum sp. Sh1]